MYSIHNFVKLFRTVWNLVTVHLNLWFSQLTYLSSLYLTFKFLLLILITSTDI